METDTSSPKVQAVEVTEDALRIELSDGRWIQAPLRWFPRLMRASDRQRRNWRLIGQGSGIHWNEIDEDIAIEGLLAGRPSLEGATPLDESAESRAPSGDRPIGRTRGGESGDRD